MVTLCHTRVLSNSRVTRRIPMEKTLFKACVGMEVSSGSILVSGLET